MQEPIPEQNLWLAVIGAAIDDLFSGRKIDAEPARHFLLGKTKWFADVCDMAGIKPEYVERKVKAWMDKAEDRPRKVLYPVLKRNR